jgi:hypothetical protein
MQKLSRFSVLWVEEISHALQTPLSNQHQEDESYDERCNSVAGTPGSAHSRSGSLSILIKGTTFLPMCGIATQLVFRCCWLISHPPRFSQLPKSKSAQIFFDGVLQEATLDAACAASPVCGGTLTVNGEKVIVPKNMMVMLPANALTWQEMFTGGTATGLALADAARKPGSYSVSVAANRVINGASEQIIAATIDISQANIISAGGESTSIALLAYAVSSSFRTQFCSISGPLVVSCGRKLPKRLALHLI